MGYTTGTDWRAYEPMYESVADNYKVMFLFTEPGYVLYTFLFRTIGVDFIHFLIITKLILYFITIRALRFYCPKRSFFLSLLFFVAWYAFFLFIDNPLRNLIAIGFFLLSLKYLRTRQLGKYLLITLVAVSFHFSAIVMLLLYYLGKKSYSTKRLIVAYAVLNVLLISNSLIFSVVSSLFSSLPIIGEKIAAYAGGSVDGEGKLFSVGWIIHTLIFILLLLGRDTIEEHPYGKMIFTFAGIFAIFFRLGLTITVMGRFQLYIIVFYVAAIGMLYYAFEIRSRLIYTVFLLMVTVIPCVSYLIKDCRYIPYTNYLFFIGQEMSFDQRSSYNELNSPYKAPEQ